ncbi:MAG: hypothetical protein JXD22_00325 [Sedimentisphaerales bacterium]|nr:hypothetical protein [Sedimentisphaerales bacterium]
MKINRSMCRFAWMVMFLLVLGVFLGTATLRAADADEVVKQIEKTLSSVTRRIVTEPGRAEKEWLEAKELLAELKASDSGNAKLSALEKSHASLGEKLEKRLGRSIGGTKAEPEAKAEEKKSAAPEQKAEASELPSSVTSRLTKITADLDAVEVAVDKHYLETARRKLETATKTMKEIDDRYANKIPEGNEEMKAARERLKTVGDLYTETKAAADAKAAAEAAVRAEKEAQSQVWIDKINPFFDPSDELYLRIGSSFNYGSDEEKKVYRKAYDKANEVLAEYEKAKFPHGKTQELDSLEFRFTDYVLMYNEDEKRAKQEEACKEWVEKLRAYVDSGSGSRKILIASATYGEEEINQRAALFEEAKVVWAEYQKAKFPLGKSLRLMDYEKEMEERLAEMPEALRQSRALVSGQIEKEFDRVLGYLNSDTGWKKDELKMPNIAMERDIKALREGLTKYASTVESDDAKLTTLKEKLSQIEKTDQANRAVCAERRYMLPEKYAGSDRSELEEKSEAIVKEKVPNAKPLRVVLPAEDWKEERVLEWTDTTQSAVRYRCTRFMTTQVAAKGKDGKVYLHSVHLASDRTSDGSWGKLYGHIMWSDWMAEKNVNKKPPKPK